METIAYLHIALAYEEPAEANLFESLQPPKLYRPAWIQLLSLVVLLSIVGMPREALALIKRGDRGPEVVTLQQRLQQLGYFNGPVNGNFGTQTQSALRQFQRSQGLNPDGVYGRNTQEALEAAFYQPPSPVPTPTYYPNPPQFSQTANTYDIRLVQQRLRERGFYYGAIDGIFGSETFRAVREFQASVGLTPNGVLGQQTLQALNNRPVRPPETKARYVVIVPGNSDTLRQVSQYVNRAFLSDSKLGSYVNAGEFANRATAESRAYMLRSHGISSRVLFRR
ncbi:MAG TPA: peptidoglycan-binding protein [Candidatus Obscuribacterales bacterium]